MSIWFQPITLEMLNKRSLQTMAEFLEIEFTAVGDDTLEAVMPVSVRSKQPLGLLHGGANVVLAETLASTAANAAVDFANYYCVGLEINANHLKSVKEGLVRAITRPIHIGRSTQVWHIDIYNEQGIQTCVSRMTAAVVMR